MSCWHPGYNGAHWDKKKTSGGRLLTCNYFTRKYTHRMEAKIFKFRKSYGKQKISEKSKTLKKHYVFKVCRKFPKNNM